LNVRFAISRARSSLRKKESGRRLLVLLGLGVVLSGWMGPLEAAAQEKAPQSKPDTKKRKPEAQSSYDQVTPVLLGQESFEAMMAKDKTNKDAVATRQKELLEERYDLSVRNER
jgi:hypothetical protein